MGYLLHKIIGKCQSLWVKKINNKKSQTCWSPGSFTQEIKTKEIKRLKQNAVKKKNYLVDKRSGKNNQMGLSWQKDYSNSVKKNKKKNPRSPTPPHLFQ